MTSGKTRAERDAEALEHGLFAGEEGGDERSTPQSDLFAAIVLAALAVAATGFALELDVPNRFWT
ncbi:MAG: hypothetical protein VW405_19150, partial [Rhodospirillaceae bacterium]